jgi:hypothetical protein
MIPPFTSLKAGLDACLNMSSHGSRSERQGEEGQGMHGAICILQGPHYAPGTSTMYGLHDIMVLCLNKKKKKKQRSFQYHAGSLATD